MDRTFELNEDVEIVRKPAGISLATKANCRHNIRDNNDQHFYMNTDILCVVELVQRNPGAVLEKGRAVYLMVFTT